MTYSGSSKEKRREVYATLRNTFVDIYKVKGRSLKE